MIGMETFTQSGAYTYNTTTVNGYDSIATLNLVINYSDTSKRCFSMRFNLFMDGQDFSKTAYILLTQSHHLVAIQLHILTLLYINFYEVDQQIHCDSFTWINGDYLSSVNDILYVSNNFNKWDRENNDVSSWIANGSNQVSSDDDAIKLIS